MIDLKTGVATIAEPKAINILSIGYTKKIVFQIPGNASGLIDCRYIPSVVTNTMPPMICWNNVPIIANINNPNIVLFELF